MNRSKRSKHNDHKTQFYNAWDNMKQRCLNKKHPSYPNYGGRGITYDSKWNDYLGFKEDMYFKYLYALKQLKVKCASLERINVNGNYIKSNCTFIENNLQQSNTTMNRMFIATNLKTKETIVETNQAKFAKEHSIPYRQNINRVLRRIRPTAYGWAFKFI